MGCHLAVDIGASSGRHMLGHLRDGRLICEEIHRFANGMVQKDGQLCWDVEALLGEILTGLKRCGELGKIPQSVGIDTWGVDFVLLGKDGNMLGNAVAYRDARTQGMDAEVSARIPEDALYARTGIQKQPYNTIYQLMAVKKSCPQLMEQARHLLLLPDYLHYRLCGVARTEYTIATTTGLVCAQTKDWDEGIIAACGYPRGMFARIVPPGTCLGHLTPEVAAQVGFNCRVVLPAAHDTASAVLAAPLAHQGGLYISSGTWSLMGVERAQPDCSPQSREANFTNEGGYDDRFRYLKNIMGLWMIQSVQKELGGGYSFARLCELAEAAAIPSIVNCNDERFFAPRSMVDAIRQACAQTGQQEPRQPGELAAVVYNSLAACYRDTALQLEGLTGQTYGAIHIIGGGANAAYLNRLTAQATGKPVYAGPTEATAIGNLLAQLIASGEVAGLTQARACVRKSFETQLYRA